MKILQPAAVLIAWTLVMLGWMLATRLPALRAAGMGSDRSASEALVPTRLPILHSLVQATLNKVKPRFLLFIASSACLALLTVMALLQVF